jgi:uncharacterized protein (TIGR03118 family)
VWTLVSVLGTIALVLVPSTPVGANSEHGKHGRHGENEFRRIDVVSDQPGAARLTDPNLVNAWGIAAGPATPLWVNDNGTNVSTIYPGVRPQDVTISPLVVNTATDGPTGIVFNPTNGFQVGGQRALFIFDSEAGDITGWAPGVPPPPPSPSTMAQPGTHVDGAIFKGLTLVDTGHGAFLYAADFHNARIDVFDDTYQQVRTPPGAFHDRFIPRGFAPFNVQALNGKLYVAYAKQDADAEDEVAGPGLGFVDVYSPNGTLLQRLVRRGHLDAPWGLTIAPKGFGPFGGDLLVGNFGGEGRINAYDTHTGAFRGSLRDEHHRPIAIDGLWGLRFGNGITGTPDTLIFSAGPDDEQHGLLGFVVADD